MAHKIDFSKSLENEIDKTSEVNIKKEEKNIENFYIKKNKSKVEKTSFPVYIEKNKLNAIDKIAKKNQISRNELINQFINYILENY